MRKLIAVLIILALAAGAVAYRVFSHPCQEAYTPDNLIRLHVVANSDRPEDQALKYRVRDALLWELLPDLGRVQGWEDAEKAVRASLPRLQEAADRCLALAGAPYPARVEMGVFEFPTRAYYETVLPAGSYRAVRVVLGEGEGANWWCVLFPPLCFVDIAGSGEVPAAPVQEVMASPGGRELQGQQRPPIEKRWRLVEWWRSSQRHLARLWPES